MRHNRLWIHTLAQAMTLPSPVEDSSANSSGSSYSIAQTSVAEASHPGGPDAAGSAEEVFRGLRMEVGPEMLARPLKDNISLGKGTPSTTPCIPSPMPSRGKDMIALITAQKKEAEQEKAKENKARAKSKAGTGKQKVAPRT